MSRIKTMKPSAAMLVAVAALVAAVGGTAVADQAATPASQHKLTSKQKKQVKKISQKQAKKQDKKQDKRNFPVGSSQIADGAVDSSKLGSSAVRASKLGEIIERSTTVPVVNNSQNAATVDCLSGEKVIGGGANWDSQNVNARLQLSYRVGNGWRSGGQNASGSSKDLTVYAYCLQNGTA